VNMPRLFVKIFLSFWLTVVVIGISLVFAFMLQPTNVPSKWHASLADTTRFFGTAAVRAFERGGAPAAVDYIHALSEDAHIHGCIFDASGNALAGESCAELSGLAARVVHGDPSAQDMRRGLTRIAVFVTGPDGRTFIYASELLSGPGAAFGMSPEVVLLRAGVAFIVSGLVCYFLTRYLTTPILRLRAVAQLISAGQLGMRAEAKLELRRDEFGDLVRDFNLMASKSENLISSQRQLLYDVSHELRSPLARMNVALDLLHRRVGEDSALRHMETDLKRLNEMITRLLTVAKLDAANALQSQVRVNLTELVSSIAVDAEFEAQEKGNRVVVFHEADLVVLGDPNLLRSAVENVLRNAMRYTKPGTAVEVALQTTQATGSSEAVIVVRDHGTGVPIDELANIFKPFYRVTDGQASESIGAGLGLAITERIVKLHEGRIRAINEPDGGLRIEMVFPRLCETVN
jgi:two-component system, OmpR family, sensor histidine kinase CpxA